MFNFKYYRNENKILITLTLSIAFSSLAQKNNFSFGAGYAENGDLKEAYEKILILYCDNTEGLEILRNLK